MVRGVMPSAPNAVYRIFGSPFTVGFHQSRTYLRLKRAYPYKLYCGSYLSTILYATYYKSRTMGTQCSAAHPVGGTVAHVWDLEDAVEEHEEVLARTRQQLRQRIQQQQRPEAEAEAEAAFTGSGATPMRLDPCTHPRLHALGWSMALYTYWWLGKTALLYRFAISESTEVIAGLLYYFFIIPAGGRGLARAVAPVAKKAICGQLAATGVCDATAAYMTEHFQLLCQLLERHFAALEEEKRGHTEERNQIEQAKSTPPGAAADDNDYLAEVRAAVDEEAAGGAAAEARSAATGAGPAVYLLGTPHPTMADVLLSAVFSSIFLNDDPPASMLQEQCPHLVAYVERLSGPTTSSGWLPEEKEAETETAAPPGSGAAPPSSLAYPDEVPPTLLGVMELMEEVMPFLLSQVASLRAFMSGPDVLRLRKLRVDGGRWEGCEAYLLPALTPIESLMIVDENLLTVRARAHDLELALRAGHALTSARDGGRPAEGQQDEAQAQQQQQRQEVADAEAAAAPHRVFSGARGGADAQPSESAVKDSTPTPMEPQGEDGMATTAADSSGNKGSGAGKSALRSEDWEAEAAAAAARARRERETVDPEEADFHRAFTRQMRRRQRAVQLAASASAETSSSSEEIVARQRHQLEMTLHRLQKMVECMAVPLYTIATVPLHRRYVTVLIPEHEAAKARQRYRAKLEGRHPDGAGPGPSPPLNTS